MRKAAGPHDQLAELLAEYLVAHGAQSPEHRSLEPPRVSPGICNGVVDDIVFHEVGELVAADAKLRSAVQSARCAGADPRGPKIVKSRLVRLLRSRPDMVDAMAAVLPRPSEAAGPPGRPPRLGGARGAMARSAAALLIAVVTGGVIAATVWLDGDEFGSLAAIEVFATAVLAFLPAWLFVRFLAFRSGALWNEFVLNLHRLELDEPQHLPRPPENSIYYRRWWDAGGWVRERARTIYQQKFDAYYGRNVSEATSTHDPPVRRETLFPVLLMTAVVAAGWVVLFQSGRLLDAATPDRLTDMLAYAFVGAYVFNLQTFVRRFFQGDLKASAYAAGLVRIITALAVVAVLYWLPEPSLRGRSGVVVAFVVGAFPLVGIQVLSRAAAVLLRAVVPTLRSDYPLSDLDGLNIWYETRLLEEGVEDMQNLTTVNLVDVMLHTRVPLGRLVDWVDQAVLYLHLIRAPRLLERRRAAKERQAARAAHHLRVLGNGGGATRTVETPGPAHPRDLLRRCGIRNATGFVTVFGPLVDGRDADPSAYTTAKAAERWLVQQDPAWKGGLRPLVHVLKSESALDPVWCWRKWRDEPDAARVRTPAASGNGHRPSPAPAADAPR